MENEVKVEEVKKPTRWEKFEDSATSQWDATAPIHLKAVNWSFVVLAIAVVAVGLALGLG